MQRATSRSRIVPHLESASPEAIDSFLAFGEGFVVVDDLVFESVIHQKHSIGETNRKDIC